MQYKYTAAVSIWSDECYHNYYWLNVSFQNPVILPILKFHSPSFQEQNFSWPGHFLSDPVIPINNEPSLSWQSLDTRNSKTSSIESWVENFKFRVKNFEFRVENFEFRD